MDGVGRGLPGSERRALASDLAPAWTGTDLCQVVRDIVEGLQEQISRSGSRLELQVKCPAAGGWDRLRLEQVITNLLINAIKFGLGRPIEVGVAVARGHVTLSVRDHGIGISDEARIMEGSDGR